MGAWQAMPACWLWTQPTEASLARVAGQLRREAEKCNLSPRAYSAENVRWTAMAKWHRDRCAICGLKPARLVDDHDHLTNLFRGFLCGRCNTWEGASEALRFQRYRDRHPAIIFNIKKDWGRRWDPVEAILGRVPPPPRYG